MAEDGSELDLRREFEMFSAELCSKPELDPDPVLSITSVLIENLYLGNGTLKKNLH